jgi:hypothetical protein
MALQSSSPDVNLDESRHPDAILSNTFEAINKKIGANVAVMDGKRQVDR